jgi:hypothetical protein
MSSPQVKAQVQVSKHFTEFFLKKTAAIVDSAKAFKSVRMWQGGENRLKWDYAASAGDAACSGKGIVLASNTVSHLFTLAC